MAIAIASFVIATVSALYSAIFTNVNASMAFGQGIFSFALTNEIHTFSLDQNIIVVNDGNRPIVVQAMEFAMALMRDEVDSKNCDFSGSRPEVELPAENFTPFVVKPGEVETRRIQFAGHIPDPVLNAMLHTSGDVYLCSAGVVESIAANMDTTETTKRGSTLRLALNAGHQDGLGTEVTIDGASLTNIARKRGLF